MTPELLKQRERRPNYQYSSGTQHPFASRNYSGIGGTIGVGALTMWISSTTDETVTNGNLNVDGSVTLYVTGGTGPYIVVNEQGYGSITGDGPEFIFTGLPGSYDYSFYVYDSNGDRFPLIDTDPPYILVHVYREAFNWYLSLSAGRGLSAYPGSGDLSIGPVTSIPKWQPFIIPYASAVLTSVGFSLDQASLRNDYFGRNDHPPLFCTLKATTSTFVGLIVEGVTRVTSTIQRPDYVGTTNSAAMPILFIGQAATSIIGPSTTQSDAPTLAAVSGVGNLSILYTSVRPVYLDQGSTNILASPPPGITNLTYSFAVTITYNYSVPRE